VQGRLLAERKGREGQQESVQVTPGSLIGCAAFLSSSRNRETIRVSQTTSLAMFGPQELDALMVNPPPSPPPRSVWLFFSVLSDILCARNFLVKCTRVYRR